MEEKRAHLKKIFLISLIVSLSISALIGIVIFLIGSLGEIEIRILLTTITIGGFSLTGLCSATLYDKRKLIPFALIGIAIAIIGFLLSVLAIWEIFDLESMWKVILTFIILSASIAHSSLLLLIDSKNLKVQTSLFLTLAFISLVTIDLLLIIWAEIGEEIIWRLLGVFAILDVLGTIVTPILVKVTRPHHTPTN